MNPNKTLGGNPTRPLDLENYVITAIETAGMDRDLWVGTRIFRTWAAAAKALSPIHERLNEDNWCEWTCQDEDGKETVWFLARDRVE